MSDFPICHLRRCEPARDCVRSRRLGKAYRPFRTEAEFDVSRVLQKPFRRDATLMAAR